MTDDRGTEARAQPVDEVPSLRGVRHAISCPVTLVVGALLAWAAPSSRSGGHHEVFHTGTVVGATLRIAALAVFVLR